MLNEAGGKVNPIRREDSTSSEMRHDWLADRWVIIAPQRTERPSDYVFRPPVPLDNSNCPFCIGHEAHTPNAVACYHPKRAANSTDWAVRVVPNKFPAVNAACGVEYCVKSALNVWTAALQSRTEMELQG